jgi:hypothetical protein
MFYIALISSNHYSNNGIIEKFISIHIYYNYVLLLFAASPVTGGPHGAVAKSSAGHR